MAQGQDGGSKQADDATAIFQMAVTSQLR